MALTERICPSGSAKRTQAAISAASSQPFRLPPVTHTMPASSTSSIISSTAEPSSALGRASASRASRWMVSTSLTACCRCGRRLPVLLAALSTGSPWLYSSSSAFRRAFAPAKRARARSVKSCVHCWMGTIRGKLNSSASPSRQSHSIASSAVASGVQTAAISILLTIRVWL